MARLNQRNLDGGLKTAEGGRAVRIAPIQELERTLMSCLLFEKNFYEDGESVAERLQRLAHTCDPQKVIELAIRARTEGHLRHAPLYLIAQLAKRNDLRGKNNSGIATAISQVVQRADELAEFILMFWEGQPVRKATLTRQIKLGLGWAFNKFDEYQFAKYNKKGRVLPLKNALRLVHPKPANDKQAQIFKRLNEDSLFIPDTWEVALSGGEDKKEVFERLLKTKKMPYMALLANMRNIEQSGVDRKLVDTALLEGAEKSKALPFRFISAAKHAVSFEPALDKAMQRCMQNMDKLTGSTVILVDVSGSMDDTLSKKSETTRMDAACGLAILARAICDDLRVFSFSLKVMGVPAREGMALADAIKNSQAHRGTYLRQSLQAMPPCDRLIVITDEQSHDGVRNPPKGTRGYMINVATHQNGVGYGPWTHIDGFSESVIQFIQAYEKQE